MPRLIWVFAGRKGNFVVLSWGGSYVLWRMWQSEQSASDQGIHCLLTQISIKNTKWKCTLDTPKIGNVLVQLKWNMPLGKYGLIPQTLKHSARRWPTHTETWRQIHKVPYCIRLWNRDLQALDHNYSDSVSLSTQRSAASDLGLHYLPMFLFLRR